MIPALLFVAACGHDDEEDGSGGTTSATGATTATSDPLADVCAANPDPANDETNQVDEPVEGDEVSSPLTVRGRIAAFEATFQIILFAEDEDILGEIVGMSSEGQTLAPFEEEVSFSVTEETPACLWVYEASARDGSPVNVVQIPLVLAP